MSVMMTGLVYLRYEGACDDATQWVATFRRKTMREVWRALVSPKLRVHGRGLKRRAEWAGWIIGMLKRQREVPLQGLERRYETVRQDMDEAPKAYLRRLRARGVEELVLKAYVARLEMLDRVVGTVEEGYAPCA